MVVTFAEDAEMRAIKSRARKLAIEMRIKHNAALELAAREFGYLNFYQARTQPRGCLPGLNGLCRNIVID